MLTLIARIALAASLPLVAGCETYPTGTDSKKVAEAIGTIKPSRADSCGTLKQVAEQSSRIESIKQGKEVVYKAPPCEPVKS
jgi:hypothetical protein